MTTAIHPRLVSSAVGRLARSQRRAEARSPLARLAIGVVALHVVDDSFLQPNPGTSAGDHLAGGLVPLALLVAARRALSAASAPGRARRQRFSRASSAFSAAPRPCTTRWTSARPATTTPGCSSIARRAAAARSRRRDAVAIAAARRPPLVALRAPAAARRRLAVRSRSPSCSPSRSRTSSRTRLARHVPAADLGAAYENVALHDERRAQARRAGTSRRGTAPP